MVFSWKSLPSTVLDVGLHSLKLAANSPETWRLEDKPFLFWVSAYFEGRAVSFREGKSSTNFCNYGFYHPKQRTRHFFGYGSGVFVPPFQDAIVANKGLSPNSRSLLGGSSQLVSG